MKYTNFYASGGIEIDGWLGMYLDDNFQIRKILPDWAPSSTGLIELGFSWENKCIMVNIMYLQVIYLTTLIIHGPLSLAWTHTDLVESPWPCQSCIHHCGLMSHLLLTVIVALWLLHQHSSHQCIGIGIIPPTPLCLSTCWHWVWSSHLYVFQHVSVGFDPHTFMSCNTSALGSLHLHVFWHVSVGIPTPSHLLTRQHWDPYNFRSFDTLTLGSYTFASFDMSVLDFHPLCVFLVESVRDKPTSLTRGEGQPTGLSTRVIVVGSGCCGRGVCHVTGKFLWWRWGYRH